MICAYLNDTKNATINRQSFDIAPVGMYTDAWDWRMSLKVGDFINCCDEYKCWYRATILEVKEDKASAEDTHTIKKVYVGYRYPDEDYGHFDIDGKKFIGWD